jgi:GntP family gluconate:H+ symporter
MKGSMAAGWILLTGMAVVVCGVLVFRLHALLSLIAGGLVVALLTPSNNTYRAAARLSAMDIEAIHADADTITLKPGKERPSEGATLLVLRGADLHRIGTLRVLPGAPTDPLMAKRTGNFTVDRRDFVIDAAKDSAAHKAAEQTAGERLGLGFGKTATDVGILIAMAAVIGQCLLESGAAERVIITARRVLGDDRTPLAFVLGGFVLTIPCFFETVFYLMIPLGKIMRARTGKDYTLYVMSIIAGGTMAHSLVPPTPGPLFAAGELHVNLAMMMLGGVCVGLPAAMAGLAYARWANRRWDIPLRDSAGLSPAELLAASQRDESSLPSLSLSIFPILLPITLIGSATILKSLKEAHRLQAGIGFNFMQTIGNKNVALILTAAVGLLMMASRRETRGKIRDAVQNAIGGSATMILIIAAGGAFGAVLQQTDIAASLRQALPMAKLSLLPLAFAITVLIRTAQGSATVAMITTAGIVSPIAAAGGLGFHPLYLALAIGCGSKPIMWMNDSGFWVISRMSGMTETETLKTATVMMAIMALVGLCVVMAGAWLLPMG